MKICIFISLITQFVSNYATFKRPEADESFSYELGYKPSAEGLFFAMRIKMIEPGTVFGRVTVISFAGQESKTGKSCALFNCICSCGTKFVKRGDLLRSGNTRSCGCWSREARKVNGLRHGMARGIKKTPEYNVWVSMKARCYRETCENYKRYGARGIKVCKRWLNSFENFIADMGPRPSTKHSLDRKNNNKDYTPKNCRWATWKEQANNRSSNVIWTYNGMTKTMAEWAIYLKINRGTLKARKQKKWSVERALSTPVR